MMETALGSFGWTEYDFYCSTLRGFINAQRGYHEEKKVLQHYLRRVTWVIHSSLVSKPMKPEEIWPIEGDEKQSGISESLLQRLKEHKEKHG